MQDPFLSNNIYIKNVNEKDIGANNGQYNLEILLQRFVSFLHLGEFWVEGRRREVVRREKGRKSVWEFCEASIKTELSG